MHWQNSKILPVQVLKIGIHIILYVEPRELKRTHENNYHQFQDIRLQFTLVMEKRCYAFVRKFATLNQIILVFKKTFNSIIFPLTMWTLQLISDVNFEIFNIGLYICVKTISNIFFPVRFC